MIDQNTPEPLKKRSFFDDDPVDTLSEGQGRRGDSIHRQNFRSESDREEERRLMSHLNRADPNGRERMVSQYREEEDNDDYDDEDYDRRRHSRFAFVQNLFHGDSSTRRLAYASAGIGGLLLLFIGGWMMSRAGHQGVPVFEPPQIEAKEKPLPESNSETIGMDKTEGQMDANGKPVLAPGPEQANPSALAAQYSLKNSVNGQVSAMANANSKAEDNFHQPISNNTPTIPVPPPISSNVTDKENHQNLNQKSQNNREVTTSEEQSEESVESEKPILPVPVKKHVQQHQTVNKKIESSNKEEAKNSTKIKDKNTITRNNNGSGGHYVVQLAALGSSSAAEKQWQVMRKKAPDLLGSHSPFIQKAEVKGNTIYRLRVKGFSSKAQASSFCGQLKAKSLSCTLANF